MRRKFLESKEKEYTDKNNENNVKDFDNISDKDSKVDLKKTKKIRSIKQNRLIKIEKELISLQVTEHRSLVRTVVKG